MAEKLTPQQQMAVKNRGGALLVSAAAGSGKTKVLVDRLMDYVLDPICPANLDDFLIITYTKAAASELRGKIAAKLSEKMAELPDNKHLHRQMQRLYLAKISTVHAFCADILREYAYNLEVGPDFRVADENECMQLRQDVMKRILDKAYMDAQEDLDFRAFVDAQGLGRDDRLVPEILMKVYDSARCHLDPEGWLEDCIQNACVEGVTDAAQTVWGKYLVHQLQDYLTLQIDAMDRCAQLAGQAEGMEKPAQLLSDTVQQLRYLQNARTWDEIVARKNVDFGRLTISKKCPDQELAEKIKAVRTACKKSLEKKVRPFADESAVVLQDMAQTAQAVRGIVSLVRRFGKEFDRDKHSRRILDFGDLEHFTLDLLLGKRRTGPTSVCKQVEKRFREIMVDEYQDSNGVQDAIFGALTRERGNCFMVGDVKQSIYQFRLADPGIFLEKYNTYANAQDAAPGEGRRVMLSANFRSGGGVLKSVNDIFALCMSEQVGGLHYGEDEALREGIPHEPLGEPEVELYAIDVAESTYREEAAFVAKRVQQLLDGTHFIRGKDGLRPIVPEDIAILLRSPGSVGGYYMDALARLGIRSASGGGEDLLQTQEIGFLRSVLQTISNPRQDIPLIATLASPVFGFTADDLASVRKGNKRICMYEALLQSDHPKAGRFLQILQRLRKEARLRSLAGLLQEIFQLTNMDGIYAAMPGGEARRANLQAFYSLASQFASGGPRDLEQFLEHLDAMSEKGLILAAEQTAAGCVTIMSIHKSKGLEFPVVFVCSLSREFNRESARAHVLCHQQMGLGLSVVDAKCRVRYPTIAKRAISGKVISDSLSEELRVLYVALTRARDRLIMTYASQNLQKDLQDIGLRMDLSDVRLLTGDAVCPGQWVLMAAMQRLEAGKLHNLGGRPDRTISSDPVWHIDVISGLQQGLSGNISADAPGLVTANDWRKWETALDFRYAHEAATRSPSKQTATQRKGRWKDAEAAENAPEEPQFTLHWPEPSFVAEKSDATQRGNAMHTLMRYIDFSHCESVQAVQEQVWQLVQEGRISQQHARLVDCPQIAAFFATDIGRRLRAGGQILREFKFSVLDDGTNYDPALSEEEILLQGVVDLALIEEDGITVVDFKTDRVTEETLDQRAVFYRSQVRAYAEALERIFQKNVKQALLYFFALDKFVQV